MQDFFYLKDSSGITSIFSVLNHTGANGAKFSDKFFPYEIFKNFAPLQKLKKLPE